MAKKKSPAELKEEGESLGTLIATARKREHAFAMLIGKEGLFIEADPKKPADVMRRKAKAAGGGSKGAQGILRVNGKSIEFHCEEEKPPRALSRLAKQHFRERGQKYKILILAAGGDVIEDDDAEELEEDAPAARQKTAGDDLEGDDRAKPADPDAPDDQDVSASDRTATADSDAPPAPATAQTAPAPDDKKETVAEMAERLRREFEPVKARIAVAMQTDPKGVGKKVSRLGELFESDLESEPQKAAKVLTLLRTTLDKAGIEAPADNGGAAAPPDVGANPVPGDRDKETGMLGGIGKELSDVLGGGGLSSILGKAGQDIQKNLGLAALPKSMDDALNSLSGKFGDMLGGIIGGDTDREDAQKEEAAAIIEQQKKLAAAYMKLAKDPSAADEVSAELTRFVTMLETSEQIAALDAKSPEAATSAREAMSGFDEVLGPGTPVTPELLAQIEKDRAEAEARRAEAEKALKDAQALTDPEKRATATATAQADLSIASAKLGAVEAQQKAAKGKKQLTEAITVGPLSPAAPKAFSDASAAKFIDAYKREPELADFAVQTAATSDNPDAIAGGMDMLCDKIGSGFADGDGNKPPEGFDGVAYAKNLVKGANGEGGDYMKDAEAYIEGGGHLKKEPIPQIARRPEPGPGASKDERAKWAREDRNLRQRERTHYVTSSVMSPDGSIDVKGDKASTAMGHLRFNPDVIDEPTPEVNGRVADMYEMLSDDTNREKAEGILKDVKKPEGLGAALVSRAADLDKCLANPTAEDSRQTVMMSLMTPVHQGAVGSCFATAGVRRMSELDPLDAMQQYADIANTGKYKPANGMDPIYAVTSFDDHEPPLIRSFEYSVATKMAEMPGNSRKKVMDNAMSKAMTGLRDPVGTGTDAESAAGSDNWTVDQVVIREVLTKAFMVEYDAQAQTEKAANDGSSKRGGYFLIQIQGKGARRVINSEALFVEAVTERVLAALKLKDDDPRKEEIKNTVSSRAFLDSMKDGKSAPWKLGGGGIPREADEVIFGDKMKSDYFLYEETDAEEAVQSQGDRSEQILTGLLGRFEDADEDMISISTNGIHTFNGLPNHPSLEPLLEGGNIAQNMEDHLLKPGREIAAADMEEHHLEKILTDFRASVPRWDSRPPADRKTLQDRAQAANLLTGKMKPKELRDAIMAAYSDYLDKLAADIAQGWQNRRVRDGKTCTDADRDAEATRRRAAYVDTFDRWITGSAVSVAPVPEFTVADTNWGSAEGTVEFVIATDPVSGEPRLWKKYLPSGKLVLMEDKWEDTDWYEAVEANP